jgi:hypothetical protein
VSAVYFCCDERRRSAIGQQSSINGIDFLEVLDDPSLPDKQRQRTLYLHLINPIAAGAIAERNILIEGGERIRGVAAVGNPAVIGNNVLEVKVNQPGDFSTYTFHLVRDRADDWQPPKNFDPILSAIKFSFKVNCPSDFDCRKKRICPPELSPEPEISYLAKDYASFKQLMLDRISALVPDWRERNPADLGVALVELLAYLGDYLSYQQDSIATEAYLGTARKRVSVRRHVRLVDYFLHEGCNARVFVQLKVNAHAITVDKGVGGKTTKLLTTVPDLPPSINIDSSEYSTALVAQPVIFELMTGATLYEAHNELHFYTWGARECCLSKGATHATLRGSYDNLKAGDVLIFAEVKGPNSGKETDADSTHKCAVKLTRVSSKDLVGDPLQDPIGGLFPEETGPVPITEIQWHDDDALPFPFCLSTLSGNEHFSDVSVAWGNIVLADHGLHLEGKPLGSVPQAAEMPASGENRCSHTPPVMVHPRFRPSLEKSPLTHSVPYGVGGSERSAASDLQQNARDVLPAIKLDLEPIGANPSWSPKQDLLNSGPDKREFVVEIENDGKACIRFGDDIHGKRPNPGDTFLAAYRIGNGIAGNLGAKSLAHIASAVPHPEIFEVWNPMPAGGGYEPMGLEQARQEAPVAFKTQQRAVTPEDYEDFLNRYDDVQRSKATLRWTGSWYTVFLTADRSGGLGIDQLFQEDVIKYLEKYRLAGQDLEVNSPHLVPLEIDMQVCVKPDYFRSDVEMALQEVFSSITLADGRRGLFHPDNFSFEEPVYLGRICAAAQEVQGVSWVQVLKFQRKDKPETSALDTGRLEIGRLEITCLDNDPNFPERGVFRLIMEGGK